MDYSPFRYNGEKLKVTESLSFSRLVWQKKHPDASGQVVFGSRDGTMDRLPTSCLCVR